MKTYQKVLAGCAGCLLLVVLGIGTVGLAIWRVSSENQEPVEEYMAAAIPLISGWDADAVEQLYAPEVLSKMDPGDHARLFKMFSQLGVLESYETPKFLRVDKNTQIPYPSVLTYSVAAKYESGDASLTLQLVKNEAGEFLIWYLHITSRAFLPPAETVEPGG